MLGDTLRSFKEFAKNFDPSVGNAYQFHGFIILVLLLMSMSAD